MTEHAKRFFIQQISRHAVEIMHRRLGSPTDVEATVDVGFSPSEDMREFVPVSDFLKRHLFYRRAGNDETVKFFPSDVIPTSVNRCWMFRLRTRGDVSG